MKKIKILREVFKVLHDSIYLKASKANGFKRMSGLEQYGQGENSDKASIAYQMMSYGDLFSEKELEKWGFNRPFTGRELYNCHKKYLENETIIFVRRPYLDFYCHFLDFESIEDFIDRCTQFTGLITTRQKQLLTQIDDDVEKTISGNRTIPEYFLGVYEGYFLRNQSDKSSKGLSKLIIYLHSIEGDTYLQTSFTAESEHKYYKGLAMVNDNILKMDFELSGYTLTLVFDLSNRKTRQQFDGYLKGVYGGTDLAIHQPVAGRLILSMALNSDQVVKTALDEEPVHWFIYTYSNKPKDLSNDETYEILHAPKIHGRENDIFEFFTNEVRYIENIRAVDNYLDEREDLRKLAGIYSVYSLRSNYLSINISKAKIEDDGTVVIIGSQVTKTKIRVFEGSAKVIGENRLLITTNERDNPNAISYHFLAIDLSENSKKNPWFNGVRIMTADHKFNKPFAGRVVFVKEPELVELDESKAMERIPLFPEDEKDLAALETFKHNSERGFLLNLLQGPDNNIIKSFSDIKNRKSRDIDYGKMYILMTQHYVNKNERLKARLFLFFAQIHGRNKIGDLSKDIRDYFGITSVRARESCIKVFPINDDYFFSVDKSKIYD